MNRNGYVLIDGEIRSASEYEALIHSEEAYAYEVIRVIDGRPLFLEEHLERLGRTLAGVEEKYTVDTEELRDGIARLLAANGVRSDNVKMILSGGRICVIINGASYPTNRMYNDGVRVGILEAERINPQAKISNHSLRAAADRLLTDEGYFEVLLQDRNGCITEGSRSNVFFIKDGEVITSPPEGVLLGITRQRIVRICEANDIPVVMRRIERSELDDFDAAFISGTSPKVLPIREVSSGETVVRYSVSDETLRSLMMLYEKEIEEYLAWEDSLQEIEKRTD